MDTAEHPIDTIVMLARSARDTCGVVVGDLVFNSDTLLPDTPDYWAHTMVWPSITKMLGLPSLSCAHGFQAFGPGVLPRVLEQLVRMSSYITKQEWVAPSWDLDLGMVLAARLAGVAVNVCSIRAETVRNRSLTKIAAQLNAAASWTRAYAHLAAKGIFRHGCRCYSATIAFCAL